MKYDKSFLILLCLIFCAQVASGLPLLGGPFVIERKIFHHPSNLSESILGSLYVAQYMNGNGIPKDITNFILLIGWLLRYEEIKGWRNYIHNMNSYLAEEHRLYSTINDYLLNHHLYGAISMVDVMSLQKQEKKNFQTIYYERIWSGGYEDTALHGKMIKTMPLYLKNKFKENKREWRFNFPSPKKQLKVLIEWAKLDK